MKFNALLILALSALTLGGLIAGENDVIMRGAKKLLLQGKRRKEESKDPASKEHKHKKESKDSCSKESKEHKHQKESKEVNCPERGETLRVGFVITNDAYTSLQNPTTVYGFDVSIWAQLCHCLDRKCKFTYYTAGNFQAAANDLKAGKIDVFATSQIITVPLDSAHAAYSWVISRELCDVTPMPTDQVRAYAFRRDCCQLVRDVQECLNGLICDASYYRTGRIAAARFPQTFTNTDNCIPTLYESFSRQTVDESCICCTFPHKPCIKVPCEIPFSVTASAAVTA
jgi:hypothetical protein